MWKYWWEGECLIDYFLYSQRSNYLIKDSRVGGKKGGKGGRKKVKGIKKEERNMERKKGMEESLGKNLT